MTRVTVLPGVVVASALIGGIVAVPMLLAEAWQSPATSIATLLLLVPTTMLATLVGFVLSVVPNLLGATMLAWLGRDNEGTRLPAFWGLVGAIAGWAIGEAMQAGGTTATAFAGIGAASALLCRSRTRWIDDVVTKEECHEQDRPHPARAVAGPRRHAADRWLD